MRVSESDVEGVADRHGEEAREQCCKRPTDRPSDFDTQHDFAATRNKFESYQVALNGGAAA